MCKTSRNNHRLGLRVVSAALSRLVVSRWRLLVLDFCMAFSKDRSQEHQLYCMFLRLIGKICKRYMNYHSYTEDNKLISCSNHLIVGRTYQSNLRLAWLTPATRQNRTVLMNLPGELRNTCIYSVNVFKKNLKTLFIKICFFLVLKIVQSHSNFWIFNLLRFLNL